MRTSVDGSRLCVDGSLAGCHGIRSSGMQVGASLQVFTFRGNVQALALFEGKDFLHSENLISMIGQ
jgi:hypothetical protein